MEQTGWTLHQTPIFGLEWEYFISILAFCMILSRRLLFSFGHNNYSGRRITPLNGYRIQFLPAVIFPAMSMLYCWTTSVTAINSLFVLPYLSRALFYAPMACTSIPNTPLCIILLRGFYNLLNGFFQAAYNTYFLESYENESRTVFWIGVAVYMLGYGISWVSDIKLVGQKFTNMFGTQIVRGYMFEYVTCPNYLGETIIWIGYAIAARTFPSIVFAFVYAWILVNQSLERHEYYRRQWDHYPKHRKAIIPFLL